MVPDLQAAVAEERRKDLIVTASRHRLAAAAAPPAALRQRLGRGLVSLGLRISGHPRLIARATDSIIREEGS
jgi:hypothetical protein